MRVLKNINLGLEDTQRISLPPPTEKEFLPPKPPRLPKEKPPFHPPSRWQSWTVGVVLGIAVLGSLGYVLGHAMKGLHPGAEGGISAWFRSTAQTPAGQVPSPTGGPNATGPRNGAVRWPAVRVSAIMAPGTGQPGAVTIDGSLYGAGDEVRGIRVVEIETHGVLLEYRGEQRRLQPGQSTRL